MKTTAIRASAVSQTRGFGDLLYDKAGARPSLDLDFAGTSSLRDKITGEDLVTYTRSSTGTYIDSAGTIQSASNNVPRFTHERVETGNLLLNSQNLHYWEVAVNGFIAGRTLAPDNTYSATVFGSDGGGSNINIRPVKANGTTGIVLKPNTTYTYSIYAKLESGSSPTTGRIIGTLYGSASIPFNGNLTSEWKRFSSTFTTSTSSLTQLFPTGVDPNTTAEIAFWGGQLEENDGATTYVPSIDTFTSRASSATYVDSTGLIKTALINQIPHSEDLSQATATTGTVIYPVGNETLSPIGTSTTSRLKENGSGQHNIKFTPSPALENDTKYTLSAYFKEHPTLSSRYVGLTMHAKPYVIFDLQTGTHAFTDEGEVENPTITSVGNGWYRCSATFLTSSSQNNFVFVLLHEDGETGGHNYGSNENMAYVWGVQLVKGTEVGDYVTTTGTASGPARYSHDLETLTPTGLYLEPAATNNIKYSNDLSQSDWSTGSATTPTGTTVAPDGTNSAQIFKSDGSGANSYVRQLNPRVQGKTYTASVYAKLISGSVPTSGNIISVEYHGGGTVQRESVAFNGNLTSEWKRFEVTFKNIFNQASKKFDVGVDPDNNAEIAFWGAQLEVGTYATSIIPTTNSTVTRSADVYTSTANLTETFEPRGLLIEEARTNVFAGGTSLNATDHLRAQSRRHFDMATSMTFTGSNGIGNNLPVACPDGSAPTHQNGLRQGKATYSHGRHYQLHTEIPIVANTWMTMSIFVNMHHSHLPVLIMRHDKNTNDNGLRPTGNTPFVKLNKDGKSIFYGPLSGTTSSHGSWEMKVPKITLFPNNWTRLELTVKTDSTGLSDKCFGLLFDRQGNNVFNINSLSTWSGLNNQNNYFWGLQIEQGEFASSFIQTAGGTKTRSADIASISGDNFGTYRTNLLTQSENLWNWNQGSEHVTPYAYPNPVDGKYDAALLSYDGTVNHRLNLGITGASLTAGYSVYVKPISNPSFIQLYTQRSDLGVANFDLINKTHAGDGTRNITEVGNGWLRLEWDTITGAASPSNISINFKADSLTNGRDGGSASSNKFYIYGPQIEDNSITNYIPSTDTFTSRLGNATYVDSNGLIKTAKINHYYVYNNVANKTSYVYNVQTPEGDYDRVAMFDIATKTNVLSRNGPSSGHDGTPLTGSIYLKTDQGTVQAEIDINDRNLQTITITDQWQRFSAYTGTSGWVSSRKFLDFKIIGNATGGATQVYGWGTQIEEGNEVTSPVIRNTTTGSGGPRYSHDPETLVPTGLYLEPAATNLIKHNTDPSQSVWVRSSTPVLSETTTAPDGSSVPWLNMTNYIYQDTGVQSNGTSMTSSIWLKAETPCAIGFSNPAGNIVTEDQHSSSSVWGSNRQRRIYLTTEWQRFEISGTVDSTSAAVGRFLLDNRRNTTANTVKIAIWGGQIEVGSFATSTIITGSSSVTRAADTYTSTATTVLDRDGGNKEALWSPTANTMFGQFTFNKQTSFPRIIELTSANGETFSLFGNSGNPAGVVQKIDARLITQAGVQYSHSQEISSVIVSPVKGASTYQLNSANTSANGVLATEDTTVNLHVLPTDSNRPLLANIGNRNQNDRAVNAPIKRITHWKTRLPDASLINITQQ